MAYNFRLSAASRRRAWAPAYDPKLLLGVLLYGYCIGVRSSPQLECRCTEDVALHGCVRHRQPYDEQLAWPTSTATAAARPTEGAGGGVATLG